MSTIIEEFEKTQLRTDHPEFSAGDTVVVNVKVREGNRQRLQAFEGVVLSRRRRSKDLNAAFKVRKATKGDGIERTFQLHSPLLDSIVVKRRGDVRQSKIYYLRDLSGRAARIKEKLAKKPETA